MSDKGILLKISECEILKTVDVMCAESLPPDLHNAWEEVRDCLICTRQRLGELAPTACDVAALIKQRETPIAHKEEA
jgi:hypothetical protein